MRTHQWTEHADSRQATKSDLRDIAAALGCVVTPSMQVPELRQRIRAALDRMAAGAVSQLRAAVREALDAERDWRVEQDWPEVPCKSRPCVESIGNPGVCCWCQRPMRSKAEPEPGCSCRLSGPCVESIRRPGRCCWCGKPCSESPLSKADRARVEVVRRNYASAPEECEDNDCTGCSWCDREESETRQ
jgi:hypothetical protein